MEASLKNVSLSSDGEKGELVIKPEEVLPENAGCLEFCLVGRFLTDQTINFNLMKSHMAMIWRSKKGMYVKNIGEGHFIFQFFHVIDLKRVEEGSPWTFGNFPTHRLVMGEHPLQVPLNIIAFWVQIYDLPLVYFSEKIGKQLGDFIGRFTEYDGSNKSIG
ncbi:hypothetical protein ACS0TY_017236 [Phlomoides rotata]